jgi:hypothetical protein
MLKLSDIVIVEPAPFTDEHDLEQRFQKVASPNNATISLLTALIGSPDFKTFVDNMRDEGAFPIVLESLRLEEIEYSRKSFDSDLIFIHGMLAEGELWDGLALGIQYLIMYNIFPQLDPNDFPDISFLPTNADFARFANDYSSDPMRVSGVVFSHRVTKNELTEWINRNWEEIEAGFDDYLPESPILRDKHSNIALLDEIYQRHNAGDSIRKICDELTSKYPDHPNLGDYAWVNNKIARYKDRISKYSSKFVAKDE